MMATANETGRCSGLVAGIDVAKARLDATAGGAGVCSFANDAEGIAALLEWLASRNAGLVVCEPTGGYEEPLVQSLRRAGIPVHLAHPNRVRAFAQASEQLAKTDRLDAQALSRYGEVFVSPGFPSRRRNQRGRNCRRCSGGAGDWWAWMDSNHRPRSYQERDHLRDEAGNNHIRADTTICLIFETA